MTSARHDVFYKRYAAKYPESYDNSINSDLVYSGNLSLTDNTEINGINAGKMVLSPTRTYAPVIRKLLEVHRQHIHGLVHCSGGAQTKILHFVENLHIIKDNLFETPALFKMIQSQSQTPWSEMYKVFNMGHRMEIYIQPEYAEEIIAISKSFGIDAKVVGYCEKAAKKSVTIKSIYGEFDY